jgi:N-methylhydantoinase A
MADGRIVGVNVGGTFNDLVLLDPAEGAAPVRIAKVPTTPDNQADGVLAALAAAGVDLATVGVIVHGATTNALLERKVARTGLITTKGFRDVLELGRRTRPQAYGMTGVFERMDHAGRVVTPLDETAR